MNKSRSQGDIENLEKKAVFLTVHDIGNNREYLDERGCCIHHLLMNIDTRSHIQMNQLTILLQLFLLEISLISRYAIMFLLFRLENSKPATLYLSDIHIPSVSSMSFICQFISSYLSVFINRKKKTFRRRKIITYKTYEQRNVQAMGILRVSIFGR